MVIRFNEERQLLLEDTMGISNIGFMIQDILDELEIPGLSITYDVTNHPIWVRLSDARHNLLCEETPLGFVWSNVSEIDPPLNVLS
jgi:hypothetical protein